MQDGIILINKEKNCTSRDVVNLISKKLQIKKVGHAGTLDPLATGLLVIGVGKGTKILDSLTLDTKEYIATVKMGILTDTLDITGKIIKENYDFSLEKDRLLQVLKSFEGEYMQMVPEYSAVKINGKKLYQYARNNEKIDLPKRLVEIKEIELLDYNKEEKEFRFRTLVSKGTYIRSLIRDIGDKLGINLTMKDLVRTKSGKFKLEDSQKVSDDILKIIKIKEALSLKTIKIEDENLLKKIKNGNSINFSSQENKILFLNNNDEAIAIYQKEKNAEFKSLKVF